MFIFVHIFIKHFQFIGVEQEGLRRIILLIIVGWYLFCFFIIYVDGLIHYDYRVIYQGYGQENTKEFFRNVKIINWDNKSF